MDEADGIEGLRCALDVGHAPTQQHPMTEMEGVHPDADHRPRPLPLKPVEQERGQGGLAGRGRSGDAQHGASGPVEQAECPADKVVHTRPGPTLPLHGDDRRRACFRQHESPQHRHHGIARRLARPSLNTCRPCGLGFSVRAGVALAPVPLQDLDYLPNWRRRTVGARHGSSECLQASNTTMVLCAKTT
jgi:hypothetical protein